MYAARVVTKCNHVDYTAGQLAEKAHTGDPNGEHQSEVGQKIYEVLIVVVGLPWNFYAC
jgi:hypothetical protein